MKDVTKTKFDEPCSTRHQQGTKKAGPVTVLTDDELAEISGGPIVRLSSVPPGGLVTS